MRNPHVVVVGGGPAGAISALKCSQLGFNTLLVEKGTRTRHKPCGGVLPSICIDILDDLGLRIPAEVMSSPPTIGLFYVPPSGRGNGGNVTNYRLLNVNRDRFDDWLRKSAETSGAKVLHEAEFLEFKKNQEIKLLVQVGGNTIQLSTEYLIGADGTFSALKRQLYPSMCVDYLTILQEHWLAKGEFGEDFYAFFRGDITPAYSYVIPKDGALVVGTGVPCGHHTPAQDCIDRFKEWLRTEFAFKPIRLEKREAAAIPYNLPICGEGNVILVGDAAAFCNHLSGEGVRLAIESGIACADAVVQAEGHREPLSLSYAPRVQSLIEFIHRTHEFAVGMTDDRREQFVKSELARTSLDLPKG
jgi:flavin-dependent dehydrogenase